MMETQSLVEAQLCLGVKLALQLVHRQCLTGR